MTTSNDMRVSDKKSLVFRLFFEMLRVGVGGGQFLGQIMEK